MEIILAIIVVGLAVAVYMNQKKSDTPNVLDVNKDGKVDTKDAVAAAEVVVEEVKKTATKAKAAVKKTAAKKTTKSKKA